ncbi:hypothetical protein GA0061082_104130 [Snodgrassella sp. R-53583]|nr:hypothetical protein GA0061082_104130 [Snodgrassella sp. R-53583]
MGQCNLEWTGGAMCIATITRSLSQVNVADMNGYIYAIGSGAEEDNQIPDEPVITNIRSIGGYAYVAGTFRYVAKRGDGNNWQELNNGIKRPTLKEANSIAGFEFIDGFSEKRYMLAVAKGIYGSLMVKHGVRCFSLAICRLSLSVAIRMDLSILAHNVVRYLKVVTMNSV